MRTTKKVILKVFILGLSMVPQVFAEESGDASAKAEPAMQTAEQIRACARKNFPVETSVQKMVLIANDRSGGQRTMNAEMFWRIDKDGFSNVMIKISAPRDLSGSSYLVLEKSERDDMFMYLPAVQRVRRIVGNMKTKPLWGTDLSYEDVKQLQGVALAGTLTRQDDGKIAGRDAYVIQTVYDSAEESAYGRVVTNIDKATCMPLQVDFFDQEGMAVKTLEIKHETLTEIDGRWQMRDLKMVDLHNKTFTEIQVEEVTSDESISGRVFSSHTFHQ